MNGAFLIYKPIGVTSFGVIEQLQRHLIEKSGVKKRDLPKMGHGGTLDPFATGLLIVLVGRGVKLARYFLGATKVYEGCIRFGQTTLPGDPTDPISETCPTLPQSLGQIQSVAHQYCLEPYLQIPPMHSAIKHHGKPLYELAREGKEVERKPRLCTIYTFDVLTYDPPQASVRLKCGSGTYVRTLAQDLGRKMGTVAMLDSLHRIACGSFLIEDAWKLERILAAPISEWGNLPCFIPFHRLLDGYDRAQATQEERLDLLQGRQKVLSNILKRMEPPKSINQPGALNRPAFCAIYCEEELIAIAGLENQVWAIERVFSECN